MQAIFLLSLRALTRGRRTLVIAVLLAVPALLAVAYVGSEAHPNGPKFAVQLIDLLFLPVLLPLIALLLATTALGGEVEDGTLIYLTLRPVSRLGLVVAKLLAATLVAAVLIEISVAVTYVIAANGSYEGRTLSALLLANLAGCLVYCSLFLLLGLFLPRRGLIVGFIYVLAWEGGAAAVSTALATLSVRRYLLSTLHAGLGASPLADLQHASVSGAVSLAVLSAMVCAGVALTTWRLRQMELH